jgi:hypothetical protein
MAGINPTLAFAVLFLGMSGNSNEPAQEASIGTSGSGCPDVSIADELAQSSATQTWTETVLSAAGSSAALPDVAEPKWSDFSSSAVSDSEPTPDVSSPDPTGGRDPITRSAVPASMSAHDVDPAVDPCGPGQ